MTGKYELWSTPGSLLIAGEYLITEEGGSGLALAAGGRAQLRIESSASPEMEGRRAGGTEHWIPGDGIDGSLASAVWSECLETGLISAESSSNKLSVDTDVFYDGQGRKLGFGSSAAAAVLFTRGLCESPDIDELSGSALQAHYNWQGGRGSGYDVLSSIYGGAGLFTGGRNPSWSPLRWPEGLNGWIIQGPGPVNSPRALDRYRAWKQKIGTRWDRIHVITDIIKSVQDICQFLSDGSETDPLVFLELIHQTAVRGSRLGREIGVPAKPVLPVGFSEHTKPWYRPGAAASKSLGAGDETILLMTLPDGLSRKEEVLLRELNLNGKALPLRTEKDGLRRETPS